MRMDDTQNPGGEEAADSKSPPPAEAPQGPTEKAAPEKAQPEQAAPEKGQPEKGAAEAIDLGSSVSFRSASRPNSGYAEIAVAGDGMTATAHFYPPQGEEGPPLQAEDLGELFARLGVVSGILWDEIGEALMRCNLERRPLRDLVVARGSLPEDEIPAHAALEPRFRRNGPLVPEDAQRVDYRQLSSLTVVKKGELIARQVPRGEGKAGLDVRGFEKPFARRKIENFLPGKNCSLTEAGIESSVDGLLAVNGDRLDVEEILLVKGDVDYHTGHIVFPGDVVIEGRIGDGFKVFSGGSVISKATMDAYDVSAKKDLLCAQGLIGRRGGQVRVGGELRARFIQNCKVAVRGDIHVANAVVGSRIYTLGTIDLSDKGVLMGGESYALHGLRCGRLGNEANQRTIVHVGTDFTVQQQLDQANERLRALAFKAKRAAEAAATRPSPGVLRLKEAVDASMVELSTLIGRLLLSLDADDAAVVEVRGDIFPGTTVEICRLSIVVDQPLKACRFRLDKTAGRVVAERLGGS